MSADPRIVRIELTPLFVPFTAEVRETLRSGYGGLGMALPVDDPWLGGDFVICKLITSDGSVGLGEAFVWLPETGVTPAQLIASIEQGLARYVLGESPFRVEHMRRRMDDNVARMDVAKGLLDMACYDLMGRITGRPACDFMGGASVREVPLAGVIPLLSVDATVHFAKRIAATGLRTLRLKLGRSIDDDVAIVSAVRSALGKELRLRVDYNQAYRPYDAVRAIRAIEPYGIDYAEQPVAASDFIGMAHVQARVDTPLMAHEGCFTLADIVNLVEMRAIGVVGLNSERPGGVTQALKAISYAETRGLGVALHNQPLGVASAMHIHLAAARHHALHHATELFGHVMLEDDLIAEPLDYANGRALLPAGAGFGVTLDDAALARYQTAPTITLKMPG